MRRRRPHCGRPQRFLWGLTVRCSSRPWSRNVNAMIFMPFSRRILLSTSGCSPVFSPLSTGTQQTG